VFIFRRGSAISVLLLTSGIMFTSSVASDKQKDAFSGILIFLIYGLGFLAAFKHWTFSKFPRKVITATAVEEVKSTQLATLNQENLKTDQAQTAGQAEVEVDSPSRPSGQVLEATTPVKAV
jgi:hypothetical protein